MSAARTSSGSFDGDVSIRQAGDADPRDRSEVESGMSSGGIARELWAYMRQRKKWWLAPILLIMLLTGALLVFAQGSALAPFIYTIF